MDHTIKINCINTSEQRNVTAGISLSELLSQININTEHPIVCARVNNKTEDLNYRLFNPKQVEFISLNSSTGMRTYVRSLCFLFFKAINDILPNTQLRIEHPISKGYFCRIGADIEMTPSLINQVKLRMRELITQNHPFIKHEVPRLKALEAFRQHNMEDKVALLETYTHPYVSYHELDGLIDFYYGALLPSTAYLSHFELFPYKYGVILQIPNRRTPNIIEEFVQQPKMFSIFEENVHFNRIMGVDTVGKLNNMISNGFAPDLLKVSEALHEKKIAAIADSITQRPEVKLVLVAGPSSSGKTTFSKRLSIQLMTNLKRPIAISLDNYFVDRLHTPLDEFGKPDYESINALDLEAFNSDLQRLLNGESVNLPTYNFESGTRTYKGNTLQLRTNDILILEGIHALNTDLTPQIDNSYKFKIYVSALTAISLDDHNWIPTADNRLLRRIIRDSKYRNHSAQQTIAMWDSVRRGEDRWIFPYQENADALFNSALLLELAVLKRYADPILMDVPRDSPEYAEAHRLLRFLGFFNAIPEREIPPTSLLREFLGGSSFKY